jgi:hypothetical protein
VYYLYEAAHGCQQSLLRGGQNGKRRSLGRLRD